MTGWRSHVELDIPRRSWIYLEYVLKVCISYMAVMLALDIRSYKLSEGLVDHIWVGVVTLVLDIPRVCIEGLHIVYGSHAGLG